MHWSLEAASLPTSLPTLPGPGAGVALGPPQGSVQGGMGHMHAVPGAGGGWGAQQTLRQEEDGRAAPAPLLLRRGSEWETPG